MFRGEAASLDAILKTETLRVPKPIKVLLCTHHSIIVCHALFYLQVFANAEGKGWVFAMEHLEISGLRNQSLLGEKLAQ